MSVPSASVAALAPPKTDFSQEVRFAVVMYGGVSLAIYINGIAQELLRLVRSTANGAAVDFSNRTATERVYRKLSYLLADENKDLNDAEASVEDLVAQPPTRFVVDIMSGTSAGGINGIFLAKALANGQDIENLKELWVREGDISSLINDKLSREDPLSLQDPPTSLLNSRRMYLELLKAFDGMDANPGNSNRSAFVDEVDLYVTSTDLEGVVLPIQLADGLVYERRHRNVLHFAYSKAEVSGAPKDRNDFACEYNPFLAYAARCTSSFPFAFEPMLLADIDDVLDGLQSYRRRSNCRSESTLWPPFFKDYQDPRNMSTVPFPKRSFGDGGYLDNKPFSYAIETLSSRQADVPIMRKLIYVEPSPEHPEDERETDRRPDFLTNVKAALLDLPRYETIREDLQRVLERNRLIARINRIMKGVDQDVEQNDKEAIRKGKATPAKSAAADDKSDEVWAKLDLAEMVDKKGRSYLAYHRLEIAAVTDRIAQLVARVAGLDEESDYFLVIRSLLRAWRERTFVEYHTQDPAEPTMNEFLWCFNLAYPMRRIAFLRSKIDRLYRLDGAARDIIDLRCKDFWTRDAEFPGAEEFRKELKAIKTKLNKAYRELRQAGRTLRSRTSEEKDQNAPSSPPPNPVYDEINELISAVVLAVRQSTGNSDSQSAILNYFLGKSETDAPSPNGQTDKAKGKAECDRPEEICDQRAAHFLDQHAEISRLFDSLLNPTKRSGGENSNDQKQDGENPGQNNSNANKPSRSLGDQLLRARTDADAECEQALPQRKEGELLDAVAAARECLRHYYDQYADYDMIMFPILYETGVGETEFVDVTRISPEDAKALIDERSLGCRKLAGTVLAHFGAFLNSSWRKNDIFWGRLDGAERIINSLLPNHPQIAQELIGDAQAAIVCETLAPLGPVERMDLLVEALMRTRSGKAEPDLLAGPSGFISKLKSNTHDANLRAQLNAFIDNDSTRQHYLNSFDERSRLDPEPTLKSAARATTVVGQMLSSASSEYDVSAKYIAWIARLGQIFWSLVEVAVPRSLPNLVFRHWLKLLYFFEVLLIISSTLLAEKTIQRFAFTAFGITAAVHLAVQILGDIMQSRRRWVNLIESLALVLLITLVVTGALSIAGVLGVEGIWMTLSNIQQWFAKASVDRWWVRIAIAVFFALFLVWAIRKDLGAWWRGGGSTAPIRLKSPPLGPFQQIRIQRPAPGGEKKVWAANHLFFWRKKRCVISFTLSARPSRVWKKVFEAKWKENTRRAKAAVKGTELRLTCPPSDVEANFSRLKLAVSLANSEYQVLVQRAKDEAKRLKDRTGKKKQANCETELRPTLDKLDYS